MEATELNHHGILGMKWGVRRYQNYDGSYTKKGLERYRNASQAYESAKEKERQTKEAYKTGTATKEEQKAAKSEVKTAKKALNESYDKLKNDHLADEGKKLYKSGKTITGNSELLGISQTVVTVGAAAARQLISSKYNDQKLADISAATIAVGGTVVNAILAIKNASDAKKLRAYYAH